MRVSHGHWTSDGKKGNARVTITFEPGDDLFHKMVDQVKAAIEKEGGDPKSLRHIEAEVKFLQEGEVYVPQGLKVTGEWRWKE